MNTTMGARPWIAYTEYDYAHMLLAGGKPADRARVAQLLASAHATCEDLGMNALADKVTALQGEVPPAVTEPLRREARKTITALWVDIAASSPSREPADPEALRDVITQAFADIQSAVERHGGSVETIAGDAITAVFGLPAVHEDDALRAVRAALEVRDALPSEPRIGLSTGEIVTGGAGSDPRLAGEPLMLSSRLGQAAEPGDVFADEATWRLVRESVDAESVAEAWRIVSVSNDAPGLARRLASPMVGRQRERRRLHDAFEQAVSDRSCQLFTVLGQAGVGKSRLVQEFLGDLGGDALVTRGRCLPYGEGITYWPLREAVRAALRLEDTDSADEAIAKLSASIGEAEAGDRVARQAAEMIGLEAGRGVEEGFNAVRALFEAWGRAQPLVVVFDDIHWGEPAFLDLVEHVADWARAAPILLVCLARPELLDRRPGWGGGKPNATSILLEGLSEDDSGQLIDNLAGEAALDEGARRRIVEAAGGNPLFIEEMLALLIDDPGADPEFEVPAAINAILAARLDQLGADVRATIEAGSVEGQAFHEGSVVELVPEALRPSVHGHLLELVRKDLILPAKTELSREESFRFRHLLIREAAYESIPKVQRARLHERHAAWLEQKTHDRAGEYDEILGYHLEQACRYLAELGPPDEHGLELGAHAASLLVAAARRAFALGDARASANLLGRATALLPETDESRLQLLAELGVALMENGDFGSAAGVLHAAIDAAAKRGDARLEATAKLTLLLLRLRSGEAEEWSVEAKDQLEQAIVVFERVGDHEGLAKAYRLLGWAHGTQYHFREVESAVERGIEYARLAGDLREERSNSTTYAMAGLFGPAPVPDAIARCDEVLGVVAGHLYHESVLTAVLALLEAMRGDLERGRIAAGRAREMMETLREGRALTVVPAFLGRFELLAGDTEAAERELRPEYELLEELGERFYRSSVSALLAEALYAQGRLDEAERLTTTAATLAGKDDVEAQMLWRFVRAKLLTQKGEVAGAEALAGEAVDLARATDSQQAQADSLIVLAGVLQAGGRAADAAAALEEAIGLYELKGSVAFAAEARASLESLAGRVAGSAQNQVGGNPLQEASL
jgi:predicted ATPase/class 3 adenylate cyclase